jgi:long-chain fatty acid transport protein
MPKAKTKYGIQGFFDTGTMESDSDLFVIPAIGISTPVTQNLRFGLAAYGVSGLGVDYRDQDPNRLYTNLQIMKFAPNLAYLVNPNFSVGAAVHVNYGSLDLGDGTSAGFSFGAQVGAIYKIGPVSLGAVYITPQKIDHENVADFDGDTVMDDLELESPQSLGFGVAYEPIPNTLLLEVNAKWLNWADADGYKDFGWDDQWVFNIGAQYKPTPKLALRAGFNYGKNPVEENNGWDGMTFTTVQGKQVNRFQYEVLRIGGFPAIVEKHLTLGAGYQLTKSVSVDFAYMHAFEETVSETGFFGGPGGPAATIESKLYEDSIDFGITWRF